MLKQKLELTEEGHQRRFGVNKPLGRIIQKYITNPLLINKKKFDIRCYMLIASTKPILALFHHGYLRLSMNEFDNEDNNLITHLTNQVHKNKTTPSHPQKKISLKINYKFLLKSFSKKKIPNIKKQKKTPLGQWNNLMTM